MSKLIIFISVLAILVIACENKPLSNISAQSGLTILEAKDSLNNIAKSLVTNRQWMFKFSGNGGLSKALLTDLNEGSVSLSKLTDDSSNATIIINNVEYTIKVGLVNGSSQMGKLAKLTNLQDINLLPVGVGVDPDEFGPINDDVPINVYDGESGTTEEVYITLPYRSDIFLEDAEEDVQDLALESAISNLNYPVFAVSIEESYDDPQIDAEVRNQLTISLAKVTGSIPYFVIKEIKLRKDEDPWGDEEFEVYIGESLNNNRTINSTTIHKFNGNKRRDVAGREVKYADVNGKHTYTMDSCVAIWPLTSENIVRIIAIDNDNDGGKFKFGNGGNKYFKNRRYDVALNSVDTATWKYNSRDLGWSMVSDDVYLKSGVDNINVVKMKLRLNDGNREFFDTDERVSGYLKGVRWKVGLKYY